MPEIIHKLLIKSPPETVYEALTTQEGQSSWWTRDCRVIPKIETVAEFYFDNRSDSAHMKIVALEPHGKVSWSCIDGDPEWIGTNIQFELSPHEKGTILFFTHKGWITTDGFFPNCSFDWAKYLLSLKMYLETGKGNPHPG